MRTVPVGAVGLASTALTSVVNVTVSPSVDGLREEAGLVVVAAAARTAQPTSETDATYAASCASSGRRPAPARTACAALQVSVVVTAGAGNGVASVLWELASAVNPSPSMFPVT